MRLAYAFLANAAEATREGKLYVLGADFDNVVASQFPLILPHLSLVIKLFGDSGEAGMQYDLGITLVGPNGQPLSGTTVPFNMGMIPRKHDGEIASLIVANVSQLAIPQAGVYQFRLVVEDRLIGVIGLSVEQS